MLGKEKKLFLVFKYLINKIFFVRWRGLKSNKLEYRDGDYWTRSLGLEESCSKLIQKQRVYLV